MDTWASIGRTLATTYALVVVSATCLPLMVTVLAMIVSGCVVSLTRTTSCRHACVAGSSVP